MRLITLIFPPIRMLEFAVIAPAAAAALGRAGAKAGTAPARHDIWRRCGSLPSLEPGFARRGRRSATPTGTGRAFRQPPRTSKRSIRHRRRPALRHIKGPRGKPLQRRTNGYSPQKNPGRGAGAFSIRRITRTSVADRHDQDSTSTCRRSGRRRSRRTCSLSARSQRRCPD
jgi:hypothetical protein